MNTFANNPAGRWMGIPKGTGAQPGNGLKQKELKQLLAKKNKQLPCPLFSWRRSDVEHRLDFIGFCESFGYMVYNALKASEEYHVMGYLAQPSKDIEYALYSPTLEYSAYKQLPVFGKSPFKTLPQVWVQCLDKSLSDEEKECVRSLFAEHMYTIDEYVKDNETWQELTLNKNIQVTKGSSIELVNDEESDGSDIDGIDVTGKIAWDNDGSNVIDVYLDSESRFNKNDMLRIGKETYTIEDIDELPVSVANVATHATTKKKYLEFLADNNAEEMKRLHCLKSVQGFKGSKMEDAMLYKGRLFLGFDGNTLADFIQRFFAVMMLKSEHLGSFKALMERIRKNAEVSENNTLFERKIESLTSKIKKLRNQVNKITGPWTILENDRQILQGKIKSTIPSIDFAPQKKWMESLAKEAVPYFMDYLFVFGPKRTTEKYKQLLFEQDMSLNNDTGGYLPRVEILKSVVDVLNRKNDINDLGLVNNKHHFFNFIQNVHFSHLNQGVYTVNGLFDDVTRFVSNKPFSEWKTLVGNDADGVAISEFFHDFMRYEISGNLDVKRKIGGEKKGCEIMRELSFDVKDAYEQYADDDFPVFTLEFGEEGKGILTLIDKDDDVKLVGVKQAKQVPEISQRLKKHHSKLISNLENAKGSQENVEINSKDGASKKRKVSENKRNAKKQKGSQENVEIDSKDGASSKKRKVLENKRNAKKQKGIQENVRIFKNSEFKELTKDIHQGRIFVTLDDSTYLYVEYLPAEGQSWEVVLPTIENDTTDTTINVVFGGFAQHKFIKVSDKHVVRIRFSDDKKSKDLFCSAFESSSTSSTTQHYTWRINEKKLENWMKYEGSKDSEFADSLSKWNSLTIQSWFDLEKGEWKTMDNERRFPSKGWMLLSLEQETTLTKRKQNNDVASPQKKKAKLSSNSFDTGDVVFRKMSDDLHVETDGVVVCFFGNVTKGSNQKANLKTIPYFSKKNADFEALKAKYKEVLGRDLPRNKSSNQKWIMKKINEKEPEYSCPVTTDADKDKQALKANHFATKSSGIQVTYDGGDEMNNDNVKVVKRIYNSVVIKQLQKKVFGNVDVKRSLVFRSSKVENLADTEYDACILVPYGKTTITQ